MTPTTPCACTATRCPGEPFGRAWTISGQTAISSHDLRRVDCTLPHLIQRGSARYNASTPKFNFHLFPPVIRQETGSDRIQKNLIDEIEITVEHIGQ